MANPSGIPQIATQVLMPDGTFNPLWYRYLRQTGEGGAESITVCEQSTFPDLTTLDAGFIFVTDFAHLIYWDGTAATFADDGNDYYVMGTRSTASPGWHAVDGATVSILNPDGTLTSKTLLNVNASTRFLAAINGADALNTAVNTGDTHIETFATADNSGAAPETLAVIAVDPHNHAPGSPASFSSRLWFRL